jgi:hypothetical protein
LRSLLQNKIRCGALQAQAVAEMATRNGLVQIHYGEAPTQEVTLETRNKHCNEYLLTLINNTVNKVYFIIKDKSFFRMDYGLNS